MDMPVVPKAVLSLIDENARKDFGRILENMMRDKNWSQSDLAREVFGKIPGTAFAKGRDLISKYIRGVTFPDNKTMVKVARAFHREPIDMLPPSIKALFSKTSEGTIHTIKHFANGLTQMNFNIMIPTYGFAKIDAELLELEREAKKILADLTKGERD